MHSSKVDGWSARPSEIVDMVVHGLSLAPSDVAMV